MSKTLDTATTDSDFVRIGYKSDALTKPPRRAGSHVTFTTEQGRVTVTDHGRELKPWLRIKIRREFVAIGLAALLVCLVVISGAI